MAVAILGQRAIFYYPPGCQRGWTLKRLLGVSLAGFLFWASVLSSVSWLLGSV